MFRLGGNQEGQELHRRMKLGGQLAKRKKEFQPRRLVLELCVTFASLETTLVLPGQVPFDIVDTPA